MAATTTVTTAGYGAILRYSKISAESALWAKGMGFPARNPPPSSTERCFREVCAAPDESRAFRKLSDRGRMD